ncbi:MAG: hypothetical protein ABIJ96_15130 [Elusimicrobiota bacterium]
MPLFDLFGLGKSGAKGPGGEGEPVLQEEEKGGPAIPAPEEPAAKPVEPRSKRFWSALLAADALILVVCLSLAGVTIYSHIGAAPKVVKAGKTAKKTPRKKQETAETPVKAPEKKTATEQPAKEKEPVEQAAKPKGPAGSPAVHAPDLPERKPAPKGEKAAPEPAKKAPEKPEKAKRTTRPITFKHSDTEAKEVSLIGMFLVSSGGSKRMFKDSKGIWQITLYLNIGNKYRYQYETVDKQGTKALTPVQTIDVF